MIVVMVRIPVGSAEEGEQLANRFKNRAGLVDAQPGFLGFELLKGDGEYISVTRWAAREDLERWMGGQGHAQAHTRMSAPTSGGHPHGTGEGQEHAAHQAGEARQGGMPASSTTVYEVVIPGEART